MDCLQKWRALIMGAIFFLGGCSLPSPSAAIRPPEVGGQVDEMAKAVQELLAPGQTVAEARPLQSPDGEAEGHKAIAAEDLDGDGERELVWVTVARSKGAAFLSPTAPLKVGKRCGIKKIPVFRNWTFSG
ncbi:hypothetical protein V3F56_07895 [Moorellaceae bacterium AZ2]